MGESKKTSILCDVIGPLLAGLILLGVCSIPFWLIGMCIWDCNYRECRPHEYSKIERILDDYPELRVYSLVAFEDGYISVTEFADIKRRRDELNHKGWVERVKRKSVILREEE